MSDSDSSKLCLACGLCCDGTLIGFVQLSREELPRVRKLIGIEEEQGNGFILQPCNKFCDKCTIYTERPQHCAAFECKLMNSLDQKELDFNTAVEMIKEVGQRKIVVEKKMELLPFELKSQSFYFKMVELSRVLKKKELESPLEQNQLELVSDIKELDSLMVDAFGVSLY